MLRCIAALERRFALANLAILLLSNEAKKKRAISIANACYFSGANTSTTLFQSAAALITCRNAAYSLVL